MWFLWQAIPFPFSGYLCTFESWVVSWILPIRSREGRERKPKNSKEQKQSWPNLSLMVIIVILKSTMYKVTTLYTSITNSATLFSPIVSIFLQRTLDQNDCQVDPGKGKSFIDCTKWLFWMLLICVLLFRAAKRGQNLQQTKDAFKEQLKKGDYISVFSTTCVSAGFAMNANVFLTLIFIDDKIVMM